MNSPGDDVESLGQEARSARGEVAIRSAAGSASLFPPYGHVPLFEKSQ